MELVQDGGREVRLGQGSIEGPNTFWDGIIFIQREVAARDDVLMSGHEVKNLNPLKKY
jgi:hypothetical protein